MPPAPRPLFAGLVDDAALFPPGNAPMDEGLRAHAAHRASSYAEIVGPFLCPVSRLDEMVATLPEGQALELSLVVDVTGEATHLALRRVAADPRLTLVGVEAAQARLGDEAGVVGENLRRLPTAVGYLEVPRTGFEEGLDLVAKGGWQAAKYRTGGTGADAFPSDRELAAFLVACAGRDLPFKLTAGLHHAVRNTDADQGFEQHGVLNVLVATASALGGEPVDVVSGELARRDGARLAAIVRAWSEPTALSVRALFRSFGCCGVTDPIDELAELGLVGPSTVEESAT
ncbi:MAG: hypothetical protein ACXV3C_08395 [Actinomycetes bacterium]